jgi:phenylacetate-CoA ligase
MVADLYTGLVSGLLFPLHERLKGHDTLAVRRSLERTQWMDAEQLNALQLHRLRNLLAQATSDVPYYRDVLGERGIDADDIRSVGDLERVPFLTKALIRANVDRLKSSTAGRLARSNTGGSSGEPLIFFLGKERVTHDVAAKWRATRWWDVDIGDSEVVVWGSPIELGAQDRVRQWRDRILRTRLLPAFEMSAQRLDQFVACIEERRPAMLFGYPSALTRIARHAEARGRAMDGLGIRVAFVTAERLYDDQRETIARVFGCRVANGYGGRDAGFLAHECPSGAMHVTAEDVIVEIVDQQGTPVPAGTDGEIVVTHLASREFPFIRYRTGDVAALGSRRCDCGRGLPVLERIQGRTTDFVVAQDGTSMHGLALIYVIRDLTGIESFKIVQETTRLTRVLVVRGSDYPDSNSARIREGLKARLGNDVNIEISFVANIEPEPSGKYRYVVSRIARPEAETAVIHA